MQSHGSSRSSFKLLTAVALLAGVCQVARAAAPAAAELAARQAVLARLDALSSIDLDYSVETTNTLLAPGGRSWPVPLPGRGTGRLTIDQGVRRSDHRFLFLKEMSRWEERRAADPAKKGDATQTIRTYRPGIVEELLVSATGPGGRISPSGPLPKNQWIGLALGLRDADDFGEGDWITPATTSAMTYARDKAGLILLSRVSPNGCRHEFAFDPAHDHALVRYRMFAKGADTVVKEVSAADFRLVNGVRVPFHMTGQITNAKAKQVIIRWEANVTRCDVRGETNTTEHYRIAWPKGTDIVDIRKAPAARIKVVHDGEKTWN
jgi:hypothetical protein